ncbi:MAG: flippase-like domain-containing protein [Actinomycetota bacterium]|nr:flippase-like domain-containing protein [Actinomycetota bacterium]
MSGHPGDAAEAMPAGLEMHQVRRRLLQITGLVVLVGLVVALIPGFADVRSGLARASGGWLALAAGVEVLSCLAYVVAFRAAFCARMSWRMSYRIGMSALGAASLLPVGGVGGLAFGAWALRRGGLAVERIARRTVAFFLLTSAVNVAAVIVVAVAVAAGILPGTDRLILIAGPLVLASAGIVFTFAGARVAASLVPRWSTDDRAKPLRTAARVLDATSDGVGEAVCLLRSGDARLLAGAIGYLVFDLIVFWACFRAFGPAPALGGLLLAYLFGQLGAAIPVPGGIGGVEAGLIGALVLYGTPAATAAVGVLAYRAVLLGIPAGLGIGAFVALKRSLRDEAAARIPCADDVPPARPAAVSP